MSIIATTLAEAASATGEIRAGGTDVQARYRQGLGRGSIVDISGLPGLNSVEPGPEGYAVGALVSVHTLSQHPDIVRNYPGLAMAAGSLATPQVRHAASLAGSLLQRTRCPYYRHPEFACFKKGGDTCPSRSGNHDYGVCFDLGPCVFPHPSTLGMVLMAYGAEVELYGKGRKTVASLYGNGSIAAQDHLLGQGEVISHIHLPAALPQEQAGYFRSIARARAEWPLVEAFVRFTQMDGSIRNAAVAIGGVAPVPLLLPAVAESLNGKPATDATLQAAAQLSNQGANPLPGTAYKLEMVNATVLETLQRALKGVWGGEG